MEESWGSQGHLQRVWPFVAADEGVGGENFAGESSYIYHQLVLK